MFQSLGVPHAFWLKVGTWICFADEDCTCDKIGLIMLVSLEHSRTEHFGCRLKNERGDSDGHGASVEWYLLCIGEIKRGECDGLGRDA